MASLNLDYFCLSSATSINFILMTDYTILTNKILVQYWLYVVSGVCLIIIRENKQKENKNTCPTKPQGEDKSSTKQ